jgi:O-antigen ligase
VFGVGPNSYEAAYQFYKDDHQLWYPFAHSDWLQTLAEWGGIGFTFIVGTLVTLLVLLFLNRASPPVLTGTIIIALGILWVIAGFDFPLQIFSIVFTSLLLITISHSLPRLSVNMNSALK